MLNITLPIQVHVSIIALFPLLFVKFEKFVSNYSYLGVGVTLAHVANRYFKIYIVV